MIKTYLFSNLTIIKKLLCTFAIVLGTSITTQTQEIVDNTIGSRMGDGNGFGTEISYEHTLGANNRLELDLGIRNGENYDGFQLAVLCH